MTASGIKYDSEKPKMNLLPPKAIVEISKVLTFGAAKYDAENWRKLDDLQNRYTAGALRHIFAHMDGEELDPETNLSHLAHAMCCLLFKLEIELEERSKKEKSRDELNLETALSSKLGSKVTIEDTKGKGKMVIKYYSYDELDGIIEKISS